MPPKSIATMSIFNQYSYVFISLVALAAAYLAMRFVLRARPPFIAVAELALAGLLVVGLLVLRPGLSDVNSVEQAESLLNNGRPTFLEFFSNFCAGCLAVKPTVDQLVTSIADDFNVLRVDIHTGFGRELREQMGFSFTPEFVLFDRKGQEVWRDHSPPSSEHLDLIRAAGQ